MKKEKGEQLIWTLKLLAIFVVIRVLLKLISNLIGIKKGGLIDYAIGIGIALIIIVYAFYKNPWKKKKSKKKQ